MLWAVRIRANDNTFGQTYPVDSAEDGAESADRVNDWVADMGQRHPEIPLGITAEVIEWPFTPAEHEEQLMSFREAEEEHSQPIE